MEVWRQQHKIKYNTHTNNTTYIEFQTWIDQHKKHWPKLEFNLCLQEFMAHVWIYFKKNAREREKHYTHKRHEITKRPKNRIHFRLNGKWHFSNVNNMKINNESIFFLEQFSSRKIIQTNHSIYLPIETDYPCFFNPIIDFENEKRTIFYMLLDYYTHIHCWIAIDSHWAR